MASINYGAREISVKIVYYGPGGKADNLQIIHRKLPLDHRSDMVSLATETDRTLFFNFLPVDLGTIKGFATKFQLYTVPGQVYYNATRKLVLRGVDGVVFVADSAADKIAENLESFQNLEDNLAEYRYKRDDIAIIIQYNNRDLPNALSIDELQQQVNKYNFPWIEAVASKGVGVFDTFKMIGKIVIDGLNKKYSRLIRSPSACGATAGTSHPAAPKPEPVAQPAASSFPLDENQEDIERCKIAIWNQPDDVASRFVLGLYLTAEGEIRAALDQYRILKKLDSDLADELLNEVIEKCREHD